MLQPTLTRAVRKLEEACGGLLLRREHLLTHLTDFGRLVRPHLEQMTAEAEAAKSTATTLHRPDRDPLAVPRAVLRRVPEGSSLRGEEPGQITDVAGETYLACNVAVLTERSP
jgi:DNA-binding transcriptional LysR family regulator